jgi:mannose/cellobiose epimerase-like protein (N-acyl-D-glucosamine 2-epimerase family)
MREEGAVLTNLSLMREMRSIINDTMRLMVERHRMHPEYGWIDLKLDAITGTDHFDIPGIRDKEHVYAWIQGRGLEAIATHIEWYATFSGIPMVDSDELFDLARTVAEHLKRAGTTRGGHLHFFLGEDFPQDGRYTMSDLFCARGLYAFYQRYGSEEEKIASRRYITAVLEAILADNFHNDQISFDASQYQPYADGRTSYAGQMLALGAVTLLLRLDKDDTAIAIGRQLIERVVGAHVNIDHKWSSLPEYTIVEWIDPMGAPARDTEGRVALDPGHALEFVGLVAQLIHVVEKEFSLDDEQDLWFGKIKELLPELIATNFAHGYREPGGIVKSVDGETTIPIHDSMPWWSLPETMRAIALVEDFHTDRNWSEWGRRWFSTCMDAFKEFYLEPSACEIAIQTIDSSGNAIPVIPATPDLDPGYHTGLSLISCHDVLAQQIPLMMETVEVDITPSIGCRLSGHAARSGASTAILDPLSARICLLETGYQRSMVVSLDLLELSKQSVETVRGTISPLVGIAPDHIIVTTTHTHTAPPVIDLGALEKDTGYFESVVRRIQEGILNLGTGVVPVTIGTLKCSLPIGINRRFKDSVQGKVRMRPNPLGSRDDEIIATVFREYDGKPHTMWINTSVHPTTLGVGISEVSADYPGKIVQSLKKLFGNQIQVLPFTGACGDVRPALIAEDGVSFREGTVEDIERIGDEIATILKGLLDSTQFANRKVDSLRHVVKTIELPFRGVPSDEELKQLRVSNQKRLTEAQAAAQDLDEFVLLHDNPVWDVEVEKHWLERLVALDTIPKSTPAQLSVLAIGDALVVWTVPGELFSSVGKRIKRLSGDVPSMLVGYSNGSLGYLPSEEAMDEGGYEVDVAYRYYGLPGPFTGDLEHRLVSTLEQMIKEVNDDLQA